jgi:rare lipoprotein A
MRKIFFYFLVIILVFLSGCTAVRRDGPPRYSVDVSKIPDAVPKVERLSKTGNRPYTVRGRRYYVLSSSKNYEQRGIASWYGIKFHGNYASNGERYNMLAMTAAHKTLPLPTYVQVTNLKNGRQVVVKVTDRGPFENNRLIDLSYAAAKKLDMVGHGTVFVDVKAIDPLRYDRYPISLTYIQVGAFRDRLHAERLKRRLEAVRASPVNIRRLAFSRLYHVRVGPLRDALEIAQVTRQLRAMGIRVH